MKTYIVFLGRRGDKSIIWRPEENPLGVYEGETAQEAMQAAAARSGVMGAFVAVECDFWGVTPDSVPKAFGQAMSTDERIAQLLEKVETRIALEQTNGEDHATDATPVEGEGEGGSIH